MLDPFDIEILRVLQSDADLTNVELSKRVHLSPSQCSRRRSALEKAGIIRGYRADLDAERLGLGVEALIRVAFAAHSPQSADGFARSLEGFHEVVEALAVAGDADYIIRVRVASLEALSVFIHGRLLAVPSVTQVRSDLVLATVKKKGGLPI